ncbi:MAG TPA: CHAT domain-containing protein, partial [Stellaceae bacterium]|nr:CHAT domain-containing protein [Stellaceae bacterium]
SEDAALRAALAETGRALDALDREIAARFPDYAELANPGPAPAAAVQSLLAPDEALLVYLTTPGETWFWAVRPDGIALFRADLGARALTGEIEALRAVMTASLDPYPAMRAFALYRRILAPALPLLAGVHHLIVVPDGALQSLPFTLLVTRRPEHDPKSLADHRAVAWLARDYAVSVVPAVSSLRALRRTRSVPPLDTSGARAPFLGVGDPVLTGAVSGELRQLPALPETAGELRAIARTLGAAPDALLLGAQAREPTLERMPLDHYRVIAFATHALLSGDLAGLSEPALVLTPPQQASPEDDGLLTASEIAALKLNAEWVVLSACNTAAGDGTPDAGGLSGLARAFFYAGARSLLVSNWPVWSKAAAALTTGAFAALAKDPQIGRAEALRRAEMAMLDPKNPPEFAHPFAWAPFALAGEGGAGR